LTKLLPKFGGLVFLEHGVYRLPRYAAGLTVIQFESDGISFIYSN